MERIDRIISGFLKSQAASFEEALSIFIEDFINDLKRLTHYRVLKLGKGIINIKNKLLRLQLDYANMFLERFKAALSENISLYIELAKDWKRPKDIKEIALLVEKMEIFRGEFNNIFGITSNTADQIDDNFIFLQTKYTLTQKEEKKVNQIKTALKEVIKMKDYKNFVLYLKEQLFKQRV